MDFSRSFYASLFSFALLLTTFFLMIGPKVVDIDQVKYCVVNVHLPGPFGVSLNCDSPLFLELGHDPGKLMAKNNIRQSRPGMMWLDYVVSQPLTPLSHLLKFVHPEISRNDISADRINHSLANNVPQYVGYVLLNLLILMFCFYFFSRVVARTQKLTLAAFSLSFIYLFNDVVKAFLLSPHDQLLILLIPTLCLFVFYYQLMYGFQLTQKFFLYNLIAGFGLLTYPLFILYLPSLCLPLVYRMYQQKTSLLKTASVLTSISFVFVLPSLVWYLVVVAKVGHYYVHESERYGQFVWFILLWQQNFLMALAKLAANAQLMLNRAVSQVGVLLPIFLLCMSVMLAKGRALLPLIKLELIATVFTSMLFFIFFVLDGFIPERLAYTMCAPWVVFAGVLAQKTELVLSERTQRFFSWGVLAYVLSYGVYVLVKDGPYS